MTGRATASTSVLSSSGIMAAGTLVSRLTGFVRAGLLAAAIGVSLHAEVFNVANTIPNSLYILVAGGVFNTVLVPQLVRAIKSDRDGGDAYANRIITLGALVLAGVTAVIVLAAPLLLRAMVDNSFFTDPALAAERVSLIAFARWCLPQIFFYGMFVLVGQILNARGRFGPMMWAPIANNVISIAVIVVYLVAYAGQPASGGYSTGQELLLGLGSTIGIVVQTLILLPYLRASGFTVRPRFDFRGTGLGHTLRLGSWTVGFVIVNQLAFYVMVHRATAGTAQVAHGVSDASGFTVYSNAFLLTQVPHSIVTVSLATATMPLVSRLAADGRLRAVGAEMVSTLRLVLAVIVPCAVALVVFGPSLATILFSWGHAEGDTTSLGQTLIAFAPGMLMFSVHYTVLRGFYAIEDTRTPFYIQCLIAAVNIVLAITLTSVVAPQFVAPALALAYGASYTVGGLASIAVLAGRLGGLGLRELVRFTVRVCVAAVPAALVAWLCVVGLEAAGLDVARKLSSLVLLAVGGTLGLVTYLALARLLRLTEIARIAGVVISRGNRV
ncbi:MAG: putative peptidoglycan lipid flippase [Nocardioidaceae bacterium]|jgi:putative peptidoglycan lipid II flippase|nr:putative peptidoglycan lipid flippase [Nocardioidaceae bacterium]